eukprot:3941990-Amphidinium_carterae.3
MAYIDTLQAGRDHQVELACPVLAADAFGKQYFPAALASTCLAFRSGAFPFVTNICGQVEFDVHPSFPLFLRDWEAPFDASVVEIGVKGVVDIGTVVRSPRSPLSKNRTAFRPSTLLATSCPTAGTSEEGLASGCMVPGTIWKPGQVAGSPGSCSFGMCKFPCTGTPGTGGTPCSVAEGSSPSRWSLPVVLARYLGRPVPPASR